MCRTRIGVALHRTCYSVHLKYFFEPPHVGADSKNAPMKIPTRVGKQPMNGASETVG
jgi:hypothetical protein